MKFKNFQTVMAAGALIGLTSQAQAQDDLSLQALFDLTSSVASKVEQPIQDAPGVITVYSRADIERLGYYTLADLANITSGYSSYNLYGEKTFETRGQKTSSWNNNKHLILVDGIPVNNLKGNAISDAQLPVDFAKRVEFLKGPASALYGVGAFYGVINVVSDEPTENGYRSNLKAGYAFNFPVEDAADGKDYYNQQYRINASSAYKSDKGLSKVNFGYYTKDNSHQKIGPKYDYELLDKQKSIFLHASHTLADGIFKGLSMGAIYMDKTGDGGDFWLNWGDGVKMTDRVIEQQWTSFVPYLKYSADLTPTVSLNGYAKANESHETSMYPTAWTFGDRTDPDTWTTKDAGLLTDSNGNVTNNLINRNILSSFDHRIQGMEGLLELRFNLGESRSLITGINVDRRTYLGGADGSEATYVGWKEGQWAPLEYDKITNEELDPITVYSAYAQYADKLPVLEGLLLTLGLREDYGTYGENSYQKLSPRAAIVQKITPELNFKLMYGTALRAPGIKEVQLNTEANATLKKAVAEGGKAGSLPDAEAEVVHSIETGFTFVNQNLYSSVAGFYNITMNPLEGVPFAYTDKEGPKQVNVTGNTEGSITAYGTEIDLQYAVNKDLRFFGNYAWAKATVTKEVKTAAGKDSTYDEGFADVPDQKINIGAYYGFNMGIPASINLIGKFVPNYRTSDIDSTVAGIKSFDAKYSAQLSNSLALDLSVMNITEEENYNRLGGQKWYPLPPRTFAATLITKF